MTSLVAALWKFFFFFFFSAVLSLQKSNFLNQKTTVPENHKSTTHKFRKGEAGGSTALLDCTQTHSPWQQTYETQDGMNVLISLRRWGVLKKAQSHAVVALHNTSVFHWWDAQISVTSMSTLSSFWTVITELTNQKRRTSLHDSGAGKLHRETRSCLFKTETWQALKQEVFFSSSKINN